MGRRGCDFRGSVETVMFMRVDCWWDGKGSVEVGWWGNGVVGWVFGVAMGGGWVSGGWVVRWDRGTGGVVGGKD